MCLKIRTELLVPVLASWQKGVREVQDDGACWIAPCQCGREVLGTLGGVTVVCEKEKFESMGAGKILSLG